jgi:hypothetical protein
MLRFKVFENGAPAKSVDLDGAHLLGSDRVPLRAEIKFAGGEIICEPRARGAAAIAIMWPVKGRGRIMLETTRLLERQRPYNLHVELARGHLMRISHKREDWGLYDFADGRPVYDQVDQAKAILVEAMTAPDDVKAAELADAAVSAGVKAGEAVALFHADVFLKRMANENRIAKRPMGCLLDGEKDCQSLVQPISKAFSFAVLPFSWRSLEPQEGEYRPEPLEQCVRSLRKAKIPIWGKSLLSFAPGDLPQWLHAWAKDYNRLRELAVKQIKFALKTFGVHVRAWEVIGGIHAYNTFSLTFEQLMDMTRVSATLVKQMSPRSKAIVGIVLPWGEYYGKDPKTIPPLLYAEMAVDSGINFDAFGLEMQFGLGRPGLYTRDLMQASAMLDRFGNLGKNLHVTAAGVPSSGGSAPGGSWQASWSEEAQAQWVREFYKVALSKPFVETVSWHALVDDPPAADAKQQPPRSGGVLRADLTPKPAYQELLALRQTIKDLRAASPLHPTE